MFLQVEILKLNQRLVKEVIRLKIRVYLDITYTDAAGDLYLYNKNDDVELILPEDLNFRFEALAKNGSVLTPFERVLSMKNDTFMGNVGDNPSITVKTETKNGNIKVEQREKTK